MTYDEHIFATAERRGWKVSREGQAICLEDGARKARHLLGGEAEAAYDRRLAEEVTAT